MECCSTTDMNRLQQLQNRAVRIITNSAFDAPASPLLTDLGLRSVRELCEHKTKRIAFKSLNDFAPNYLRKLLIRDSQHSCRALRNTENDLRLPLKKPNGGQKGYSEDHGIVSQPMLSVHNPRHHSNLICN